ncbi:hypothetical protein [Synechococcus sp. PCC 7336]|uniref:hypothetical protein n=1 Tax=Synechococcus sp. PCC 7336 TaxID=195250 RepID=UPI00034D98DB|nr:hypothetical protein [Synechococcus sp. PCC 7336]
MAVKKLNSMDLENPFTGTWYITEMELWGEDYFNMETQAYVEIQSSNRGDFQYGNPTPLD